MLPLNYIFFKHFFSIVVHAKLLFLCLLALLLSLLILCFFVVQYTISLLNTESDKAGTIHIFNKITISIANVNKAFGTFPISLDFYYNLNDKNFIMKKMCIRFIERKQKGSIFNITNASSAKRSMKKKENWNWIWIT